MNFKNLVKGDYELQVTLKNSKTSKMFTSNLTVIPKRELEARPVKLEKLNDTIVPSIPLADRMEFNEPVFYASLYNKDP